MSCLLFSVTETFLPTDLSLVYQPLDVEERRFSSMRKTMKALKRTKPDIVLAEFFYGFSNNYAGVNISNLDVLLYAMQTSCPDADLVVLVSKVERQYVDKLNDIFAVSSVLTMPFRYGELDAALRRCECVARSLSP